MDTKMWYKLLQIFHKLKTIKSLKIQFLKTGVMGNENLLLVDVEIDIAILKYIYYIIY